MCKLFSLGTGRNEPDSALKTTVTAMIHFGTQEGEAPYILAWSSSPGEFQQHPRQITTCRVKVRFCAPPASFFCLAVDTECFVWPGCRTKRRHDNRDRQPNYDYSRLRRGTHSNGPARRRLRHGKNHYQAHRHNHVPGRNNVVGQYPGCAGSNTFASATFPQTFRNARSHHQPTRLRRAYGRPEWGWCSGPAYLWRAGKHPSAGADLCQ